MTLVAVLRGEDLAARLVAMAAIRTRGVAEADEVVALLECLGDARKAIQRPTAETLAALAAHAPAVRTALDQALESAEARRRWGAAYALARLDAPTIRLLPVLLETLGGNDGDLRWAAADIVLALADRPAVLCAMRQSARDGNPAQRKMALYCLRDLDDRTPETETAAHAALTDDDPGVRLAAIATVARLATDRARAAARLIALLDHPDPRTPRAAAAALGTLADASTAVIEALERAKTSPDAALRRAAERSLHALTPEV